MHMCMCEYCVSGEMVSVVVGVVGMGHVPGIKLNWVSPQHDIREICRYAATNQLAQNYQYLGWEFDPRFRVILVMWFSYEN